MFGTIRKHQKWLWLVIIVLTSVSLLFFYSQDASFTGAGSATGDYGSINGKPIKEGEYRSTRKEMMIQYFLRNDLRWPPSDEQTSDMLERETVYRVFIIQKQREMGIQPSDKAVAMMIREQIRDMPLAEIEKTHLAPQNLTAADYERYVRHEVGIRQLVAAAAVSAKLIGPAEAEVIYRKENQEAETQLALFWTSNYVDKVVITNGAISNFFATSIMRYRVPERMILSYVEFPATNYYADAEKQMASRTNLDAAINEQYFQRDTNKPFWQDDKGAALSEADAKKKIRENIREEFAHLSARRAAAEFGSALIEPKSAPGLDLNPNNIANLDRLAATNKLIVKTTRPFDPLNTRPFEATNELQEFTASTNAAGLENEELRTIIRKAAAELKDANPIRFNPIAGPLGFYVIARKGMVPAEMPPLEKISAKVTTDYKNFMSRELAAKAGAAFGTNVTNGLALGKTFPDICKAEGVAVVDVPPFSITTQSLTNFDVKINLRMLQSVIRDLEAGKATPFLPFLAEGAVVYLKSRPKLDDAKVKAALPEFVEQLRNYRQNDAFNQWFRKQAEVSKLALPAKPDPAKQAQK